MSYSRRHRSQAEMTGELRRLRQRQEAEREKLGKTAITARCMAKGLAGITSHEPRPPIDHIQMERDRQASIQRFEADEAARLRRGRREMAQLELEEEIRKCPRAEIIGIIKDGETLHFHTGYGGTQVSQGAVLVQWSAISPAQPMPTYTSPGLEPGQLRVQGLHIEGKPTVGAKGRLIPYVEGSRRDYTWGFKVGAD